MLQALIYLIATPSVAGDDYELAKSIERTWSENLDDAYSLIYEIKHQIPNSANTYAQLVKVDSKLCFTQFN